MCHAKQTVIGVMGKKGLTPNESSYVMFDDMSLCEILCLWNQRCGIVMTNTRCVVSSLVRVFVGLHSVVLMPVVLFLKSVRLNEGLVRCWPHELTATRVPFI